MSGLFFVSGRNVLRFLIDFRTNGLFQTREGRFGICDFLIRYALEKVLLIDGASGTNKKKRPSQADSSSLSPCGNHGDQPVTQLARFWKFTVWKLLAGRF